MRPGATTRTRETTLRQGRPTTLTQGLQRRGAQLTTQPRARRQRNELPITLTRASPDPARTPSTRVPAPRRQAGAITTPTRAPPPTFKEPVTLTREGTPITTTFAAECPSAILRQAAPRGFVPV